MICPQLQLVKMTNSFVHARPLITEGLTWCTVMESVSRHKSREPANHSAAGGDSGRYSCKKINAASDRCFLSEELFFVRSVDRVVNQLYIYRTLVALTVFPLLLCPALFMCMPKMIQVIVVSQNQPPCVLFWCKLFLSSDCLNVETTPT